jgi:hypothetical protein
MGPARFLCATLLKATRQKWKSYSYSYSGTSLLESIGCEYGPACLSECCAFVAQWLEHWSCKPGVESSNLSEGFCKFITYFKTAHIFRLWIVVLCGFIVASDRIRYHVHHIALYEGKEVSDKSFAQRGARTHDPQIKSLMLYRLS